MTVSDGGWTPLGAFDGDFADAAASGDGAGLRRGGREGDRPARWLTASMVALGVLAAASAVVSYAAQYRMVLAAKGVVSVAALGGGRSRMSQR